MKENRQSFRFASSDAVHGELILVDGKRWPITIADQSASGFGVLTASLPPTKRGDLIELRTDSFSCEVRVVHMTKCEGAAGNGVESPTSPNYLVGLARVRDISIRSVERRGSERQIHWRRLVPGAARNPKLLAACIFGGVVVASVIKTYSWKDGIGNAGVNPRRDQVASTEGARDRNVSSDMAGTVPGSAAPRNRKVEMDSTPVELRRFPGALPFVMTGVVRDLKLAGAQIERIHQIIDDTNAAIAQNEEVRQLFEAARSDAVGVLTVEQRRQWESLSGANRSAILPGAAGWSMSH